MSVSTGRMSRADAQQLLTTMQPALREFSSPDASPDTLQEVAECSALRSALQDSIDRGHAPDAAAIRSLRSRLAALQWDRLAYSASLQPMSASAAVVFLYGLQDEHSLGRAAHLAAVQLRLRSDQVRLQDSSPVRTATKTGTRYIFLPADLS